MTILDADLLDDRLDTGETFLTAPQVAKRVGVCHVTVLRWIKEGALPGYKISRMFIVCESDLEKFAAEPRIPGRPRKPEAELVQTGRAVSLRLRFRVLERDRFTCRYCGRSAPDVALQVDHIMPTSKGGPSEMENLVTACQECNLGKSNRLLDALQA